MYLFHFLSALTLPDDTGCVGGLELLPEKLQEVCGKGGPLKLGHHIKSGKLDVPGVNRKDVALKHLDEIEVEGLQGLVI